MNDLPSILALLGVVITVLVNFILGYYKNRTDTKNLDTSADKEFRDDLLGMIEQQEIRIAKQNERIEKQDSRIQSLQDTITSLWNENQTIRREKFQFEIKVSELENDNKRLQAKVTELQDILAKFESKVFYKPKE